MGRKSVVRRHTMPPAYHDAVIWLAKKRGHDNESLVIRDLIFDRMVQEVGVDWVERLNSTGDVQVEEDALDDRQDTPTAFNRW